MLPPGLLLTFLYRRLSWHARKLRSYWDIVRLPSRHLPNGQESVILDTGEKYGFVKVKSVSPDEMEKIPWLIPETAVNAEKNELYIFGVLNAGENGGSGALPARSKDPFVSFGILPAETALLARRYAIKAYAAEIAAWIALIMGVLINIIFIFLILSLLRGI
jgi:hypothetical protein